MHPCRYWHRRTRETCSNGCIACRLKGVLRALRGLRDGENRDTGKVPGGQGARPYLIPPILLNTLSRVPQSSAPNAN
eukprot:1181313-Prorocentrum_minimum.AAC.4